MKTKNHIIDWIWVLLIMVIIITLSVIPGELVWLLMRNTRPISIVIRPGGFKVGHVIAYGVLGGLVYRAHRLKRLQNGAAQRSAAGIGEPFLHPLLIVLGFAILDELVQHFIPGRTAQLSDVILDTTAALIVMVMYKLIADSL